MTQLTHHTAGMICWADLATSDLPAAKAFYASLFGWTYDDRPLGNGDDYAMAQLQEGSAAGLYRDARADSAGPHWNCYFAVQDAAATAAKVEALGGKLLAPAMDVFDAGRAAVFADPGGAVICLWQAKRHIGVETMGVHGSLCWAELMTRQVEESVAFYGALLGLTERRMSFAEGHYTVLQVGEQGSCGVLELPPQLPAQVPAHWYPYFLVEDVQGTLARALEGGAQSLAELHHLEGVGSFVPLKDPQGAVFALLQPSR